MKTPLIKGAAEELGWTDVHGGPEEGGMYWRGVNPATKHVEEFPLTLLTPEWMRRICNENERLKLAIERIANQKIRSEMDDHSSERADWEGLYEICVLIARSNNA